MHRIQGGTGSLRVRVCGVMALAIGTAIGLATAALWSPAQAQQDYPARSVRMVTSACSLARHTQSTSSEWAKLSSIPPTVANAERRTSMLPKHGW